MSGICGIIHPPYNLLEQSENFCNMAASLRRRGGRGMELIIEPHFALGACRQKTPSLSTYTFDGLRYTVLLDGFLQNASEMTSLFALDSSDTLGLLAAAYHNLQENFIKGLRGQFALAIYCHEKDALFLARDPLGVKPLYYAWVDGVCYFASEIKGLLACLPAKLKEPEALELLALSPAATPGRTYFSDIYELTGGEYIHFSKNQLYRQKYWLLSCRPSPDDVDMAQGTVRELLSASIRQSVRPGVAAFLSGGLDSSIVCAVASEILADQGHALSTYSIEYQDNEQYFSHNAYQPEVDDPYIQLMTQRIKSRHHTITLSPEALAQALDDAVLARDMPGMADIDSSLLLACRIVEEDTILTGECADELFGGYPWFQRSSLLQRKHFPWISSMDLRKRILSPAISHLPLQEYARDCYQTALAHAPCWEGEDTPEGLATQLYPINLNIFGANLLNRQDRMGAFSGKEIRSPFADSRLAQYTYQLPWRIKNYGGQEKGVLRRAFRSYLPQEVRYRKKSPYPKTYHPLYTQIVVQRLEDILLDKNAPLHQLIDASSVYAVLEKGLEIDPPWYGQLMRGPQFFAFLCQLNFWLDHYHVSIEL